MRPTAVSPEEYAGSYARVGFPRPTTFDAAGPAPARYVVRLLESELNHGMPAMRTLGPVLSVVGRRGLPVGLLGTAIRARPRRLEPDLDRVVADVTGAWPQLREGSTRLPAEAPPLHAMLVRRSTVDMVFLFGEGEFPLLVLKRATDDRSVEGLRAEAHGLATLAGTGVAPLHLGEVDGCWVQEALPGLPLRLESIAPGNASGLLRPAAFDHLDRALLQVAAATARPGRPPDLLHRLMDAAIRHPLPDVSARAVRSAAEELRRAVDVTVLQHSDLSAQNWIVEGDRFSGLIDWETCAPAGTPGIDVLEAAVSVFEHSIALARWSDELVVELFEQAWTSSPYFEGARAATVRCIEAAGLPPVLLEPLVVSYFAGRVGRKVTAPGSKVLSLRALVDMLEVVARGLR
jgi:hypothetical protein